MLAAATKLNQIRPSRQAAKTTVMLMAGCQIILMLRKTLGYASPCDFQNVAEDAALTVVASICLQVCIERHVSKLAVAPAVLPKVVSWSLTVSKPWVSCASRTSQALEQALGQVRQRLGSLIFLQMAAETVLPVRRMRLLPSPKR